MTKCSMAGCRETLETPGLCIAHRPIGGETVYEESARERQDDRVTTAEPNRARPCIATTRAGNLCKGYAITASDKCASHSGKGLVADPVAAQAKSAESRRAKANAREAAVERAKTLRSAGVRGALALALEEEVLAVVRRLVQEPLAGGDPKLLLAALNQAFGNPLETVRHEDLASKAADELRTVLKSMTSEQRQAEILRLGKLRVVPDDAQEEAADG